MLPTSCSLSYCSIYTREMAVLSALVEEARLRYGETSKKNVTIYSVDAVIPHIVGVIDHLSVTIAELRARTRLEQRQGETSEAA